MRPNIFRADLIMSATFDVVRHPVHLFCARPLMLQNRSIASALSSFALLFWRRRRCFAPFLDARSFGQMRSNWYYWCVCVCVIHTIVSYDDFLCCTLFTTSIPSSFFFQFFFLFWQSESKQHNIGHKGQCTRKRSILKTSTFEMRRHIMFIQCASFPSSQTDHFQKMCDNYCAGRIR